jgi:hypothetical protein
MGKQMSDYIPAIRYGLIAIIAIAAIAICHVALAASVYTSDCTYARNGSASRMVCTSSFGRATAPTREDATYAATA